MTVKSEMSPLLALDEKVKAIDTNLSALDFFNFLRHRYIEANADKKTRKVFRIMALEMPDLKALNPRTRKRFAELAKKERLDWVESKFHLEHRIRSLEELARLFPSLKEKEKKINAVLEQGFQLSILPLNMLLPAEAREKSLPKSDYFDVHPTKEIDPYGIFLKKSKVIDKGSGMYLASRKFKHSALMNIHTFCPMGCVGCYKSYYTREKRSLGVSKKTVALQAQRFVEWLNKTPEVYDVIISGGEPLMVSNSQFKELLEALKKAEHLKIVRVCTGTIFLGLPFRIDDELLEMLKEFSEATGKRVTFNAHLANHFNFTPEAVITLQKIKEKGFKVYSQVPIQEGVNFFKKSSEKTMKFLVELGRRQVLANVEPYKFIVDMHPRTLEYYVPLEPLLRVWSRLGESHDFPELERPRTLSILCQQGNVILSGYSLFALRKVVDRKKKLVRYFIPAVFSGSLEKPKIERIFTYIEPLMKFNAKPDSLVKLAEKFFIQELPKGE